MILDNMRPCLWKLELGLWTSGLLFQLGPSSPNVVSQPQTSRSKHFLRFTISLDSFHDSWGNQALFMKIEDWVLDLWLDVRLLGPNSSNVDSRSQTPRSRYFLRFHNFIGFISWFLRKWSPVCDNWSPFWNPLIKGFQMI